MSHLTPEAKSKLSSTVRALRNRLLTDLQNAVESAYLLAIPAGKAKLREAERTKRRRLEAYLDEQERGEQLGKAGKQAAMRQRHLQAAIKQAATTLLNRLVVLKQMEAIELIHPKVVTGGWTSSGYREWREFAPELCGDETEGMGLLLGLLYDEWAIELPGLFGPVGVAGLIPVPAATLRAVIEALDAPELGSAWRDDTTLGWVYQYWNDPEREALDAKLNAGGKVEPHEIASKTQMFTERYMVEWLLQNSLGQQWLGICDRNNWIPEAQADGTLERLEERRSEWRSRREAGEVALDALMSIETEMEERWKYWVRQPLLAPSSPRPPSPTREEGGAGEIAAAVLPSPILGEGPGVRAALAQASPSSPHLTGGEKGERERWEVPDALRVKMRDVAREFRKVPTATEKILWQSLRGKKLDNRKFRRQQPIGMFVVDFFCAAERLIVEVDGAIHDSQQDLDRQRQELLESLGLRFVRLKATDVENALEKSLEVIRQAFAPSSPQPPSPTRGEGGAGKIIVAAVLPSPPLGEGPGVRVIDRTQDLTSIRSIKILDPACGSGHFLVIAIDLLLAMYREEAGHRGEVWSDAEILESILENNLYGVDIDPRAVQIAAAALVLKVKGLCGAARPKRLNLVAANLQIAALAIDDPALVELRSGVLAATGMPEGLTNRIVQALKGADVWGSLLKVDREVDQAIAEYEASLDDPRQGDLFEVRGGEERSSDGLRRQRKDLLLENLERFLSLRTGGDDLGLRLRGEQLAAGVRFIRLVREGMYDLVIGNPPYQGASKMADAKFLVAQYPRGKADLYAAFLERGLQLVKPGGISAMLTMRNWMFIQQFSAIREYLIETYDLCALGDLDQSAFEFVTNSEVLSVVMSIFRNHPPSNQKKAAIRWTQIDEQVYNTGRYKRKVAAFLCQAKQFEFRSDRFRAIKEQPIVYWWDEEFLDRYVEIKKIGDVSPAREGLTTADNPRFLRTPWEIKMSNRWFPYIKGAVGKSWIEPYEHAILWSFSGLEIKLKKGSSLRNESFYLRLGIAFTTAGNNFSARVHRFNSIFDAKGRSIFPDQLYLALCSMNSKAAKQIMQSLNPTIDFSVGDVNRLPLFPIESATEIFAQLDQAFTQHEAARETSVEFQHPGPSTWAYAQTWAQQAVDRPAGAPLPDWHPTYDQVTPEDWISYSIGIALGRFGQPEPSLSHEIPILASESPTLGHESLILNDESPTLASESSILNRESSTLGHESMILGDESSTLGHKSLILASESPLLNRESLILDDESSTLASQIRLLDHQPHTLTPPLPTPQSLPHGILYLSAYNPDTDSLSHPAAKPIQQTWEQSGSAIAKGKTLHHWLRHNFFKDTHLKRYDQRPIYFPLSSAKLNFVAHISIHRWHDATLPTLLADHLVPDLTQLDGELADLIETRLQADLKADRKTQNQADDRYSTLLQMRDELKAFIALVRQCADQGPPPASPKDTPRETDARFIMDLDDGVMINSAALWPLLEPQWKKPKAWWSELCNAQGKKDYDWAHLAARYFPDRVDTKCQTDPSLAVAHGCFWRYHPAKAYEWELRLQAEIGPDFTIAEADSTQARQAFEANHPASVLELKEKEEKRRDRKRKKAASDGENPEDDYGPLFDDPPDEI